MSLILDKRRSKSDGTYPLVFRIRVEKQYKDIPSGYSVKANRFNEKTNKIINDAVANAQLDELRNIYYQRLKSYALENVGCENLEELKVYMLNKQSNVVTLGSLWRNEIDTLESTGRHGNARVHKIGLSVVAKEVNIEVPITKFTHRDLITLETKMLQRGVKPNSISVYMRSIRTICNLAINRDYATVSWYPFRKFKIKRQKTVPRVMTMQEIKNYFSLELPSTSTYYHSWLVGKLIFMLRGINIVDLLNLKPSNIVTGRIIYKRFKTGKMYSIKISPEIQEILNQFTPNNTLLGLLKDEDLIGERMIHARLQKQKVINSHLKKVGALIGCVEPITTYVFRYSYANASKQLGYSKDMIAEALGHEYGNGVTGIYLELFDLELIDKMNEVVIRSVLS